MSDRTINLHLGIGAIAAALLLALYAIPTWVSSPTNVGNVILSPLFWPYALSGFTALVGLGLVATALVGSQNEGEDFAEVGNRSVALLRLAILAAVLAGAMLLMPRLGMVWTMMIVFAIIAFLVRTSHPLVALASALALPLVLYAFFMHVAGVAIPQGDFVRLP